MGEHESERVTGLFTADEEKMRRLVAIARDMGDVAITMVRTFDPDSPLSVAEQQRQQNLDQRTIYLLQYMNPGGRGHDMRLADQLKRNGIWTVRDMFVVGANHLHLSDLMKERLVHAAAEAYPDEELKGDPTPADVAMLCHDLSQVTASVVPFHFNTDLDDFRNKFGYYQPYQGWLSVADLLDETNPEPRRLILHFDRVRDEAMRFAVEFMAAKDAT
jgi:hypothetical protein